MQSNYFREWQENRIDFIINQYGENFFHGKRILELGAYNGYIGYRFNILGAEVECIEGRIENVENIKRDYPSLTVKHFDLDTAEWNFGTWDIIINFGLYYHLEKHHAEHLINCVNHCNIMFFESVIYDSDDAEIYFRKEIGDDQSLSDVGGTPTTSYVENIFNQLNIDFKLYNTIKLNGNGHHYDWQDKNSKILDPCARRFWIVNNKMD